MKRVQVRLRLGPQDEREVGELVVATWPKRAAEAGVRTATIGEIPRRTDGWRS